jgi:DNA-binding transcriptional ArsR family regulator
MSRKRRRGRRVDATGRSIGDEQFIGLGYATVRSPAWRSLSGAAVKVWCELRSRYNGGNNGKLSLSLDEGARLLPLSKSTVRRALEELAAKGFIVLMRRGRWFGRMASEWRVTDRSCNGYPASYDWKRWKPGVDLRPPRPNPENEADEALAEMHDDSKP